MDLEKIEELCKKHNLELEKKERPNGRGALAIRIPKEREFTTIYAVEDRNLGQFDELPDFYSYRFVKGYEAIWSMEKKILECEVDTNATGMIVRRIARRLEESFSEGREDKEEVIIIPSPLPGVRIELGTASVPFDVFSYLRDEMPRMAYKHYSGRRTTIKISNINVKTHAEAIKVIKGLLSSICFQINIKTDVPIQLCSERKPRDRRVSGEPEETSLSAPKYEYDSEPLSMFWVAENMPEMPLQQYFSYYQAIEFYFTVYSQMDAQRQVRNLLMNPQFNANNDKDLSKVLNVIKYSGSSNSFGNELSQLRSTLKSCINVDDLRDWFSASKEREEYFDSKPAKKISNVTLKASLPDDDLIDAITRRVYETRCRIVHTKGTESNVEVLYHLSNETSRMKCDIELLQYLCRSVIISNGKPLHVA